MTLEEMRRRMQDELGTSPIPDATLVEYADLVATLCKTVDTAARDLEPEEAASDYTASLEKWASGVDHDR